MGRTLTEKLLLGKGPPRAFPDSAYFEIEVDLVLGHDATISLLIDRFERVGGRIWNPSKCFFAADHFAPPSTPERADILRRYLDFVEAQEVPRDLLYRGISHQLLVEDPRCSPGMVICGADSHTTMAGALGTFATGLGSTDILALLLTGKAFLPVPDSVRITLVGKRPGWLFGKDIALAVIARLGPGGAVGRALEYHDLSEPGVPIEGRMTIANMAVEAGATNAVFAPDEILVRYIEERDARARRFINGAGDFTREPVWYYPDEDAEYLQEITIDLEDMPPLVALPGSPGNVVPIDCAKPVKVHQVFIGSCAGGRKEDIDAAARLLSGKRVAPGVRLVVTPASQSIYEDCLRSGAIEALTMAGALVTNSSCGACGGIDKGLIGAGEVCVSTSNRNFRGRMGSPDGLIYLASPLTAAAAALTGELADPRPFMGFD
ncbi:MAG TPA: aconitase/3-isopropylmalate dehydratase large subunit family protein [Blastocatellia bacterium]|jgi:3-isopropylmalate/(R)-2-methylmalate dehydratase large subunit|nr:aconitase/3-isopropylmalate dehydratase large subunit family protein [Blastocatellia bacterium]